MSFSLNQFEAACYRRDKEAGTRLLVDLIQELDAKYGLVGDGFQARRSAPCLKLSLSSMCGRALPQRLLDCCQTRSFKSPLNGNCVS